MYCLEITNIDPIKYGLIFERFLNPERVGMPDVDTDFGEKEKVVEYLKNKYGNERVCQVINFSYITPVVAIKDVGKVLGIPYKTTEKISKSFVYDTFEECLEANPDIVKEYAQYEELFRVASKISGRVRHSSVHAGGVGIVDTSMDDYMGMIMSKQKQTGNIVENIIQVDKKVIENIGIIKFDLLGLGS